MLEIRLLFAGRWDNVRSIRSLVPEIPCQPCQRPPESLVVSSASALSPPPQQNHGHSVMLTVSRPHVLQCTEVVA